MKKTLLSIFAVFAAAAYLAAAEIKIAVIDMNKVFQEYNKTRMVEAKLQKQAEIFRNYSTKLADSLSKLQSEFRALRDAAQNNLALSPAERENKRLNAQDKYAQCTAKQQELQNYNREKSAQLREEQARFRAGILADITSVVSGKCQAEGISLVLDRSGKTLNEIPSVVYSTPAMDITNSVIKTLNLGLKMKNEAPESKGSVKK